MCDTPGSVARKCSLSEREGRGFHTEHAFFIPLLHTERLHGIPATFVALIDVTIRAKNALQLLTFLPASSNAATARH
jgi:hypothetical protein